MGIGVVADLMAFGQHPLHQAGMRLHVGADHEEGGGHVLVLQDVQDRRRPVRIGPVIEGQRQLALAPRRRGG